MKKIIKSNKNIQIFLVLLTFSFTMILADLLIEKVYFKVTTNSLILEEANEVFTKKENLIKEFLKNSKRYINSIDDSVTFQNYLNEDKNITFLKDMFMMISSTDENIMQIRYIDEFGNEKIKIARDFQYTQAKFIKDSDLENKEDRYYFKDSKTKFKNKIWVSKIDLNIENNQIEIPFKPTIRTIKSINRHGEFKGILIINYFAQQLLDEIKQEKNFKVILSDELGFIIAHYDLEKEWGYYKKEKYSISNEFEKEFLNILNNDTYNTNEFKSKTLALDLYDNLYLILVVDEKFIKEEEVFQRKQHFLKSMFSVVLGVIFSLLIIKIFGRVFNDFEDQKLINERLEIASTVGNVGFWEYEAKSKNFIWSKVTCEIFEVDKSTKITFDLFLSFIPDDEGKEVNKKFSKSIRQNREYFIEHKIITQKGNVKFLAQRGKHFFDKNGIHTKTVGTVNDITEIYLSKQLNKKVIQQAKEFKKLFDKFDENVIASTTDLKGIITYTSKAFCIISGYTKEELVSSPQNIVRHPDSPKETFENLWKTIQSENIWSGEIKNRKKDGTDYWVYAIIYPEFDDSDKLIGYSAIRHDITSKKQLEEANIKINSSIEYASFIQNALIPSKDFMKSCFSDKFVIWQPKDIVGGDIYLLEKLRNDDECLLMLIDCTGHGVPGAFVSMLVKAIERQIIQKIKDSKEEVSPSFVLQYFNQSLKLMLHQENRNLASNIGFDGGVIYYNKRTKILKYSGAVNNLIFYDKNNISILRGNRYSIGYKNSPMDYDFKNYILNIEKGMKLYLFTDGYIDQIGGEKGQSFSRSKMVDILSKNIDKSMEEQKKILLDALADYQKDNERVDDITVLGIEI